MEKKPQTSIPLGLKQAALTAFILLNLLTIGLANWHPRSGSGIRRWIDTRLPSSLAWAERWSEYGLRYYGYAIGLDPRWTMFSSMAPYTGMYLIKARHADGHTIVLPLPLQSPRSVWQHELFDFKEPKFHSNLAYSPPIFRTAYSRSLCRTFPLDAGQPVTDIVWESEWQTILDPQAAARQGHHWDPIVHRALLYTFACSAAGAAP